MAISLTNKEPNSVAIAYTDANILISHILILVLSSIVTAFGDPFINLHATIIFECPSNLPINDLVNDISGHHTFT